MNSFSTPWDGLRQAQAESLGASMWKSIPHRDMVGLQMKHGDHSPPLK